MTHRARVNIRKAISLLTAVSILFCNTGFVIYSETETEQEPVTVLYEDESLRGEYEKHFVMSDGTYLAVAYPDQIHYEEDGEWKDIDNTLLYDSYADRYVNTSSGDFSASFASTAGTAKTVKLEEDEYELSWRVRLPNTAEKLIATTDNLAAAGLTRQQAAQISTARVEIQAKAAALAEMDENERAISTENTASQIVYPNLLGNGIDVRYTLSPYTVEEDVVLHNRVYSFTGYEAVYSRNGLTAVHNEEENTVLFYDRNGNIRFTMNPPSMYDSADAVSTDIDLTVTNTASEIIIRIEPDTTWLGSVDRVYPVVIDPTSHTYSSSSNIDDTYVKITETSGTNLHYSEDRFRFGMYDGVQTYGFLRHRSLPLIPANAYISSAYCNIYQVPSQTVVRFNVGIMTAPWSESTINVSNIPSYTTLQTNLSYSGSSTSNRYRQIDITNITRQGYAEYNTTGNMSYFGLGFSTAEPTVADWNAVCSSSYATSSKRPTLTISYTLYDDAGLSNDIYRIENKNSGRFLEYTSTYPSTGIKSDATGQRWKIIPRGNGTYSIHPYSNLSYALTLAYGYLGNNGQILCGQYLPENTFQRWSIVNSNGSTYIRPAYYNDKVLRETTSHGVETYYVADITRSGWKITSATMVNYSATDLQISADGEQYVSFGTTENNQDSSVRVTRGRSYSYRFNLSNNGSSLPLPSQMLIAVDVTNTESNEVIYSEILEATVSNGVAVFRGNLNNIEPEYTSLGRHSISVTIDPTGYGLTDSNLNDNNITVNFDVTDDPNEPENNTMNGAVPIAAGATYSTNKIPVESDIDWYHVNTRNSCEEFFNVHLRLCEHTLDPSVVLILAVYNQNKEPVEWAYARFGYANISVPINENNSDYYIRIATAQAGYTDVSNRADDVIRDIGMMFSEFDDYTTGNEYSLQIAYDDTEWGGEAQGWNRSELSHNIIPEDGFIYVCNDGTWSVVNVEGDSYQSIIENAINAWNNNDPLGNDQVIFESVFGSYYDILIEPGLNLEANGTYSYGYPSIIRIDATPADSTDIKMTVIERNTTWITRIVMHELGHALGLGDLYADCNIGSIMYGTGTSPDNGLIVDEQTKYGVQQCN